MWVARKHALEPVPEAEAPNFFDSESYAVLYEYKSNGGLGREHRVHGGVGRAGLRVCG